MLTLEEIFTNKYTMKLWRSKASYRRSNISLSGPGSDIEQTGVVINMLPKLFEQYNILTMLDIPCGDFFWMSEVDLSGVVYIGADIVKHIVEDNIKKFEDRDNVVFCKLDIDKDMLPKVDLVFCRDCLMHFCFDDIFMALRNIVRSGSEYLLTTIYIDRRNNRDIQTGRHFGINLQIPPFNLPKPIMLVNEGCSEHGGIMKDKSLALWKITDVGVAINA